MSQPIASAAEFYSALARDPELVELVELFVLELPDRLAALHFAADAGDLQEVARLAHQLKGAGGSHGFPHLTAAARLLERAARESGSRAEVLQSLDQLREDCANSRAGVPE